MDREKCKVKFSGSLLSGICLWMVCLLFMPGTAKSQSESSYRTDAEYLLRLLDSTDLNIDIQKSLGDLDVESIKQSFLMQVDTVSSPVSFYRIVHHLFDSLRDGQARIIYPGNAYWLKGTKEEFQTFARIFEINRIEQYRFQEQYTVSMQPNKGLPYSFVLDSGKVYFQIFLCNLKNRDWSKYEWQIAHLKRMDHEKEIIIDARYCELMAGVLWPKLLRLLLDTDLEYSMDLAVKKSNLSYNFLNTVAKKRIGLNLQEIQEATLSDLNDQSVYVFTRNMELKKSRKSLKHSGKIMILFDENASLSLLSLLRLTNRFPDRFITVGKKINYTGGIGLPPFEYVLPYSKIMVSIPSAVEIRTNPLKICSDHTPMFENPTEVVGYPLDEDGCFVQ